MRDRLGRIAANLFLFMLFFTAGLALSRLLYEVAFPRLMAFARPIPVFILAAGSGAVGLLVWHWFTRRQEESVDGAELQLLSLWVFSPLFLNLIYLVDPEIDLVRGLLFFATSVWLSALFTARAIIQQQKWSWLGPLFILSALLPVYLISMPRTVGAADTFEFQVVIPQLGIAHPTGYPLYILLGRLFTFIPIGSAAWRVNLASVAFATLAALLLYAAARRLLKRPLPAVLAAVHFGLTPIFWSQAIQAEVYALHALILAAVLWLLSAILEKSEKKENCTGNLINRPIQIGWQGAIILLAFLIGLGVANHLTTLFLLPPALLALLFAFSSCFRTQSVRVNFLLLLKSAAAFLLPLLLYAYLPIRWYALHNEAMGFGRFIDWVIGGRFQGALQLTAWLTDMTRYEVVGRLMLLNWGWVNLLLILTGLLYLIRLNWRTALVLAVTWLGFAFYALNYYVPDLAVFIIPAHVVMALFWAAGLTALLTASNWLCRLLGWPSLVIPLSTVLILLLLLPSLNRLDSIWSELTSQRSKQLVTWGEGVLAMPLDDEAAILADSEKIAPLYYLQQAEGVRPDLDIMVLPDEAAYRAELEARLTAGQTVYLARFLPGLEGIYHLRSFGPLIEVSQKPLPELPMDVEMQEIEIGPMILVGADLNASSSIDPSAADVTLYWQIDAPLPEPHFVYLRWTGEDFVSDPVVGSGQHPAGNMYPTGAWEVGEIVSDFHLLPHPINDQEQNLELQVAIGPAFQQPEDLSWHSVRSVTLPTTSGFETAITLRAQNGRTLLSGAHFPSEIRPQTPLPVILTGYGHQPRDLRLRLQAVGPELSLDTSLSLASSEELVTEPFTYAVDLETDLPNGRYYLLSEDPQAATICGWMAKPTSSCILGEVEISGYPLPDGAANFEDKIALLEVDLPQKELQPGGQLPVNLHWQSLSPMTEDYTVFIQLLDAQDRIVGQVDAWPLQGTFPTSQWAPGEIVQDPYLVQLAEDMPLGPYRLQIGWYLLSTLRRLPVLEENGLPVDDKVMIGDLFVPE